MPTNTSKEMPSTDYTEAKSTGENNKLPAFPMNAPKDDFNDFQKHAEMQTKYLKMHNVIGGRRRRRKSRKKRRRRRRRSRKRSRKRRGGRPGAHLINRLPPGALPVKDAAKAAATPYFNKINEIIMAEGNWVDVDKGAAGGRRRRRRRRRQRGGQKGKYGKPGIGSEDSLCGAYQTPEETQYTPDKYIVVPQPGGSSGGPLAANDITINLAKALTQARANSEGDFSVIDTTFQDDREKIGMGEQEKVDADQPPPEIKISGTSAAIKAAEKAARSAESAAASSGGQMAATLAAKQAAAAAAKAIPATKEATAAAVEKIREVGEAAAPKKGGVMGMLGSAAKAMDPTGGVLSGMLGGGRRKSRRRRRRRKSRKKKHRRRRTRRRRRLKRKSRRR